jgi:hypothetical protein
MGTKEAMGIMTWERKVVEGERGVGYEGRK